MLPSTSVFPKEINSTVSLEAKKISTFPEILVRSRETFSSFMLPRAEMSPNVPVPASQIWASWVSCASAAMSQDTLQCVQAKDFNLVAFDSDSRSPWTKVLPIEILLSEAET